MFIIGSHSVLQVFSQVDSVSGVMFYTCSDKMIAVTLDIMPAFIPLHISLMGKTLLQVKLYYF